MGEKDRQNPLLEEKDSVQIRRMPRLSIGLLLVGITLLSPSFRVQACIWDSETMKQEQLKSPQLAAAILSRAEDKPDPIPLLERIRNLQSHARKDDPAWWNDLAGAYIRIGKPKRAAEELEPLKERFPDDYGIHANLG